LRQINTRLGHLVLEPSCGIQAFDVWNQMPEQDQSGTTKPFPSKRSF